MRFVDSPLVSIICLCYNHEHYVTEALDSVKNQDYTNLELIILDDNSTDNSVNVIKNWIYVNGLGTFIENSKNLGSTRSFNKALKVVSGSYIVDLAADDYLNPTFVSRHLKNFNTTIYPNVGVSFSNVESVNASGEHISYFHEVNENLKAINKPKDGNVYTAILESYYFSPIGLMSKKEVYDELAGYDETLAFEDLDFWIRSSRHYQYSYVDDILAKKRELSTSLSSNFLGSFLNVKPKQRIIEESLFLICKKAFFLNQTGEEHKALIRRIKLYYWWVLKSLNVIVLFKFMRLHFKIMLRANFKFGS